MEDLYARLSARLFSLLQKGKMREVPNPTLVELLPPVADEVVEEYEKSLFRYSVSRSKFSEATYYNVAHLLSRAELALLRTVVSEISRELTPSMVRPLEFSRLVEVLQQLAAVKLGGLGPDRVRDLAELAAFEAIGLATILSVAKDDQVTEFFVDSSRSPIYLDHAKYGRCETKILLTEREREAIATHMDTFRGYTPDFSNPSLKNDVEMGGARLRISLDLEPLSVTGFSLDVRRLNMNTFSLDQLVRTGTIGAEAAAFLISWLEFGLNLTIVGETGTGKTTLLNAIDEKLERKLRRVYIEDAVETKDLLSEGYHQLKLRVDPFDRANPASTTKETEIIKVLHRSPDIVILSELQSAEHSRAFFQALSSGINGIQTFHASSPEQAIGRWTQMHGIPKERLLDVGIILQVKRPERLRSVRIVTRICQVTSANASPCLLDLYLRDEDGALRRKVPWEALDLKRYGIRPSSLQRTVDAKMMEMNGVEVRTAHQNNFLGIP